MAKRNLVCPRDHYSLEFTDNQLICPQHHTYPVVDGIPIMLIAEVEPTQWRCTDTIKRAALYSRFSPSQQRKIIESDGHNEAQSVDSHVQQIVMGTCGYMYETSLNNLPRYPIPELRLPAGAGKTFLDIGCNWGRWCIAAARQGYQTIGLDPGLADILAARRISRQLGVPTCFVVGDGRYLPFRQDSIDTVFSYSVLQHFSKPNAILVIQEIARTLKENGTSYIQMPNAFGVRSFYHQAKRKLSRSRGL